MEEFDLSKWIVDKTNFVKDKTRKSIYDGGGSAVSFWIQKGTKRKCAKKTTLNPLVEDFRKHFDREILILAKYHHPAIIPFIGYYEEKNLGNIYLETMENGSLERFIDKVNKEKTNDLDDTQKLIISYGIAAALEYLHSHNVLHRDIKPLNVLLDSKIYPYITDFDFSKESNPNLSTYQSITMSTAAYTSPEFYSQSDVYAHTKYIDYYAYGMLLYRLITELVPFKHMNPFQVYSALKSGARPTIPDFTPDHWKKLIEQCWDNNPTVRPDFTTICNILESSDFVNSSIDMKRYNEYKNIIKPIRNTLKQLGSSAPTAKLATPIIPDKSAQPITEATTKPFINLTPPEVKKSPKPPVQKTQLELLREEAKSGNFNTQLELANSLVSGTFGPPDYEEAKSHFLTVANRCKDKKLYVEGEYGVALCMIKLGKIDDAEKYLLKGPIPHGKADASYLLAEIYYGRIKDKAQVRPDEKNRIALLYERAAKGGNVDAIIKYSTLIESGEISTNPSLRQANKYFKIGSDNGIPEMMHKWSIQLEFGRGVEKDVKQAMDLLKGAADIGCAAAQFDYGIHLLNGVNVKRDPNSALNFFKNASQKGHSKAMVYFYFLVQSLSDNPSASAELAEDYLNKAVELEEPDALAAKGQILKEDGQIDNSIEILKKAADLGSLLGLIELGNIYEDKHDNTNAQECFRKASLLCHAHDTLGFNTPIPYEVLHCSKCNLDICKGCAKHCHKGHNVSSKGVNYGFVCNCGQKGLGPNCLSKIFGTTKCYQHLYKCVTCNENDNRHSICKSCVEKCHNGHNIIDYGIQYDYCDCGCGKKCKCGTPP